MMVAMLGMTQTVSIGGLNYTLSGNTALVAAYHSVSGAVVIPDSVVYSGNTYIVTSINDRAFSYCLGLTSITIGNSVTSIGDNAFYGCSGLTSVTIPNSVTSIGSDAFRGCSGLTSVTIPNSVASIGSGAFQGCSGLTSVTIGNSVTSIGNSAFYYCSGLTSVTIPNSVTSIGDSAFAACLGLTSITIPNSVTSIGNDAFYYCSGLTSVTIPNSVTSIGDRTFCHCSGLTSVTIPNSVTSIGSHAFYGCSGLTSVTIPNSVTSIGDCAFYNCRGLTSITIPNSVASIGDYAFYNCSSLTSVTIPNSVTSIGDYAFYICSGLTSIIIPNSVTSIGVGAFCHCSGLTSIVVSSGNTIYDSHNNCNAIIETATNTLLFGCQTTTIPTSVTSIGSGAFSFCSGLTSITIPNSVTSIGNGAFQSCSGLTSLTIPNSVTSIGDWAFQSCSGLTSITIPNSVTSFGKMAFYGCSGLTSVTIGNSVTSIGNSAFSDCSSLTSVSIGNSVTSIGDYAFSRCFGLTSVTIPNSVTIIGDGAFSVCIGLDSIVMLPLVPPFVTANSLFDNNASCYVPCGSLAAYQSALGPYYSARFVEMDFEGNLTLAVNDSLYGSAEIIPQNGQAVQCSDSSAVIQATAAPHYHFVHWSNGRTANPDTLYLEGDSTVTAFFAPDMYTVSAGSNDEAMGVVAGGGAYAYLDTVTLTATAFAHHHFVRWSDGETDSVRTEVVSGDLTLTAIFAIDTHMVSVTLNDEAMGSVVGAGAYPYSTEVSLEAVPEEGYRFVRWGDGSTDNPAVFTLTGDTTVSAIFEEVEIPSICKVSVQGDRNVVFWNKEHEVEQYRVYREGAVAGDYELVATVPYSEPSVWTDEESRPGERRYSYKMTVVDAQGNESPFSEEHKTMHLTISQGTGNQWNLTWLEYRGAELESYMIYRGTEENDLQLIGQLPAGGAMSYTDEAAPAGTVYYQVAAVMSSPCDIAGIEPLIRSNIAVGEGEDSVGVRDVQAGNLQVWNAGGHIHVSLDGHEVAEYRVYDAIGREVYHATREARTPALPGGVYLVKVAGHPAHKVVVLW